MLKKLSRKTLAVLGLFLTGIIFINVIVFSNSLMKGLQLDLTESKLFTLTSATRSVLNSIDEPIKVRLFFSKSLGIQSPNHGIYFSRVRELLRQYESLSQGNLKLEVYDPNPFSDSEDLAISFGLTGANINSAGDLGYFGIAATNSTDDEATIPFLTPAREMFLEYDLTKMIHTLINPKKPNVGLISSLPIDSGASQQPGRPGRWTVVDQINEFFEITPIASDTDNIPEDIDVLMIVHPKNLKETMLYSIDQFVLRGGRVLAFVDSNAEAAFRPGPANKNDPVSDFDSILESWGVRLVKGKIAGDISSARRVNVRRGQKMAVADYVVWLGLTKENFNHDDVVTGDVELINVATPGILESLNLKGIKFDPLIQTSLKSMKIDREKILAQPPDVIGLFRDFIPSGEHLSIAARVTGKIETGFPDGPPKKNTSITHVAKSDGEINVIVVADTDILQDSLWVEIQNLLGNKLLAPYANNADFVLSALDNLSGSQDLISLRGRSRPTRDFDLVREIRQKAELKYRTKEQELQGKLTEIRNQLNELVSRGNIKETDTINSKQKKAIDSFRSEMSDIRTELRYVQLALRQDIEQLDSWLKFINIAGIPILIVLGLFVFLIFGHAPKNKNTQI